MANLKDWRWWAFVLMALGAILGAVSCGYFIGQRGVSIERDKWDAERNSLNAKFPDVRADERLKCTREYDAKLEGMQKLSKQQADDMADMKRLMQTINDLASYTLRYLGDRAKVADQRNAAMLKQTKVAAAAAIDAKQTAEQVDQKVNVAVTKADEAASAVKSVDKKLDTATHGTAAVPPTPWIGNRR
ncbi:hypothetical protein [Caballeronia sp. DA-9]|uniref:hypothetical protein n=1 Tax=Caballeronia sp. DA-9 TaxID=3436237 RepID=UPI003F66D1BB